MAKKAPEKVVSVTATEFIEALKILASAAEAEKYQRYFKTGKGEYGENDQFMGARMGEVFELAKSFIHMPPGELEILLENDIHEVRAGALSIMDKQARDNKTPETRRRELYDLYMRRHDRINNWDLVDVSAIYVVGRYLFDKDRGILYKMAVSDNIWERRTAIVSTAYFIRKDDVDDTFAIAELLLNDQEDLIHKAAGGWIRHAGRDKHRRRLLDFLDRHAAVMPRTMLRYAIEHLDDTERKHYLNAGKT